MNNCKEAISLMHEYFDEHLSFQEEQKLKRHLAECEACDLLFKQYEKTEAYLFASFKPEAPADLANKVMASIPSPRKRTSWIYWIRRHPGLSAAAVFVIIMVSSMTAFWNQDSELIVKGTDLDQVVIHDHQVIVPEGTQINGDLTVENGQLQVEEGVSITGDVIVIDGEVNLASTAHIGGKLTKVNQAIDWLWYKLGTTLSNIAP